MWSLTNTQIEVLPLQYQDNGENILLILKKRYGLNYLVLYFLFPPSISSFVASDRIFTSELSL